MAKRRHLLVFVDPHTRGVNSYIEEIEHNGDAQIATSLFGNVNDAWEVHPRKDQRNNRRSSRNQAGSRRAFQRHPRS